MVVIEDLIAELATVRAGLPDQRTGQSRDGQYSMTAIGLSAFSLFFMGSPSFLAHQQALARGHGQSNCQTLFGMTAIPSDNSIRQMLDGASPAAFDHLFLRAIEAAGPLTRFHCLGERVLIVLDGSEYFCSRKISCPQCSTRRRADGGTAYFHAFLGATLVAPGHHQVLPLPPECIAPQDGTEKQDGERNAAKRWLARHGRSVAHLRPVFLGDDLFACQPIAIAIQQAGGNFILTCKPSSHQTITEYLHGAELAEHRQTIRKGRQHTTIIYRWLSGVPLCASADTITVNWFSVEIRNAAGKRTYYNSFVTGVSCAWLALHRLRRANAGHIPGRGDRAGAVWPADRRRRPLPAALSIAAGEASGKADDRPVRRQSDDRDDRQDQPGLRATLPGLCRCRARAGGGCPGQAHRPDRLPHRR